MALTPEGAQAAQLDGKEKDALASDILAGKVKMDKYVKGVCFDAAAFGAYMAGSKKISPNDIASISGNDWKKKFDMRKGKAWDGKSSISKGKVVGFYRPVDKSEFHAALSVGGTKVRAINGFKLGDGWNAVDLKKVLGDADENGQFDYDGTKIEVYVCKV